MLTITLLGTSAAVPSVDRNVAALAVQREGETLLFDCGEGTQRQMMRYGVGFAFREIFFTHYHADHMLGVIGLLRTMGLQDRTEPMTLYGPRGAHRVLGAAVALGIERNRFDVEIVEIAAGQTLKRGRIRHRGVRDRSPGRHGGLRAGGAHPAGPLQSRQGARSSAFPKGRSGARSTKGETIELPDGRLIEPAELVGAPQAGTEAGVHGRYPALCHASWPPPPGADLLVHEATFGEDERVRAVETGHSTAARPPRWRASRRAAAGAHPHQPPLHPRRAGAAGGGARRYFPRRVIARDGLTVDVPFAD